MITYSARAAMKARCSIIAAVGLGFAGAFAQVMDARAAEIKVSTARLVATVLREVGPQFERETGDQLKVTEIYGPQFIKRVSGGQPFDPDVVILQPRLIDELIKDRKLIAETRTNLVQTGIGVEVRAGAPKPDINSVEAIKRTLLNAKSSACLKSGVESAYLDGLRGQLGIAEAVEPKLIRPETDIVSTLTAKCEVELGIAIIAQIVTTAGVELVGPFPPELQRYYIFPGAISTTSKVHDAAMALIRFLKTPAAARVIRSQGMEPRLSD
jgi:molybdate transport system substrate-binding protein